MTTETKHTAGYWHAMMILAQADAARLQRINADLLAALEEWKEYMDNNGGAEAYSFSVKTNAALRKAKGAA